MDKYVLKYNKKSIESILRRINILLSNYLTEIYRYNNLVKYKNYYLKPIHIVVKKRNGENIAKYIYYGRYWYKLLKKPRGIKWIYIGREKPEKELPDPPRNPLEGLVIKITENEVVIITSSREIYDLINSVLSS